MASCTFHNAASYKFVSNKFAPFSMAENNLALSQYHLYVNWYILVI